MKINARDERKYLTQTRLSDKIRREGKMNDWEDEYRAYIHAREDAWRRQLAADRAGLQDAINEKIVKPYVEREFPGCLPPRFEFRPCSAEVGQDE